MATDNDQTTPEGRTDASHFAVTNGIVYRMKTPETNNNIPESSTYARLTAVKNGIVYRLTTPEGVVAYLSATTSVDEWNERVRDVKEANSKQLPPFWYKTFVKTGLLQKIRETWGTSIEFTGTSVDFTGTFGKQFPLN